MLTKYFVVGTLNVMKSSERVSRTSYFVNTETTFRIIDKWYNARKMNGQHYFIITLASHFSQSFYVSFNNNVYVYLRNVPIHTYIFSEYK